VQDEGIGIAPEYHKLVFETFRQVESGNTRRFGGTGLGLSISQKITELHGGRIHLESVVGKGSTFRVELPAARETLVQTPSENTHPQSQKPVPLGS
jgi:signal transduction histidine kinase